MRPLRGPGRKLQGFLPGYFRFQGRARAGGGRRDGIVIPDYPGAVAPVRAGEEGTLTSRCSRCSGRARAGGGRSPGRTGATLKRQRPWHAIAACPGRFLFRNRPSAVLARGGVLGGRRVLCSSCEGHLAPGRPSGPTGGFFIVFEVYQGPARPCDLWLAGPEQRSPQARRARDRLMLTSLTRPAEVLVIDDDPAVRCCLKHLLEREGRTVATACDGRQALDYLRSNPPPRLILLDLTMPAMDGREFLLRRQQV